MRAVLFDLDDTLFDHHSCATAALLSVHEAHDCFRAMPFDEFSRAHAELLERLHADVMLGRLDVDSARAERFRRLFALAGVPVTGALLDQTTAAYRRRYLAARQSVAGAAALLAAVHARARIAVVSNNIVDEQRAKLLHCGLDCYVDALVVSEEIGVAKPNPAIFHAALARVDAAPGEAVMVGDSWAADVCGARAAGIRAVWLNRHGAPRPEADAAVAEIRALEPLDDVLSAIFQRPRAEAYADRG